MRATRSGRGNSFGDVQLRQLGANGLDHRNACVTAVLRVQPVGEQGDDLLVLIICIHRQNRERRVRERLPVPTPAR